MAQTVKRYVRWWMVNPISNQEFSVGPREVPDLIKRPPKNSYDAAYGVLDYLIEAASISPGVFDASAVVVFNPVNS
jgi:hypothetical protein